MTAEEFLHAYSRLVKSLHLSFTLDDLCRHLASSDTTPDELDAIGKLLEAMLRKKNQEAIQTLKKRSRIPQRAPEAFANFDRDLLNAADRKMIASQETLSFINAKRNVVMVGPTETRKTHLAMADGSADKLLEGLSKNACPSSARSDAAGSTGRRR